MILKTIIDDKVSNNIKSILFGYTSYQHIKLCVLLFLAVI